MSCNSEIMAGTRIIFSACLFGAKSTRVPNCIKTGDGEMGSSRSLAMKWPDFYFSIATL